MDIKLASGRSASHSNSNGQLRSITLTEIIQLACNPDNVEKTQAQWFMASMLKSRSLEDQKSDGQFAAIWCDIDKSPPVLDDLCSLLDNILDGSDYVTYTTKSATKDAQNSRVIVPLLKLLTYEDWHASQLSFNNALEALGIKVDRCSERANQIAFLPNRGAFYDCRVKNNERYFEPPFRDGVTPTHKRLAAKPVAKNVNDLKPRPSSLIDAFNAQHSINEILIQAGYDQDGSKFRHPNSLSGSYSASVQEGRVHSMSTSDPLYSEGGGVGAHNAFSAFNVLFHDGNLSKALFDAGERWVRQDGVSWNTVRSISALNSMEDPFLILATDSENKEAIHQALGVINSADIITKVELCQRLKALTGIPLSDIKRACKEMQDVQLSQMEIAEQYLLRPENASIIACEGALWQCGYPDNIWKQISLKKIGQQIATGFKRQKLCRRASDYKALSDLVYDHTEKPSFFEDAPKGIATPTYFYSICGDEVTKATLNSDHRARFQVGVEPSTEQPFMLLKTLRDAFSPDEADEQIRQLRMFTGLAIFNLQHREQKALLLYGVGGSFKSGFQKIIEKLARKEYLSAVSPLEWDQDYKKAELVGKLINLVPEINNDKVIPGAEFKSVVGCDRVLAREAYGKAFSFRPGCAHWFNSNFFLATRDQSSAFWRRWAIIHFSTSKPELERDPNLAETIIRTELPMILNWAIEGVVDYLESGLFLSPTHVKCLDDWKRESNSVQGWMSDTESNGVTEETRKGASITLVDAYKKYEFWCRDNGLKVVSSKVFRSRMEDLGYQVITRDGYKRYKSLWSSSGDSCW